MWFEQAPCAAHCFIAGVGPLHVRSRSDETIALRTEAFRDSHAICSRSDNEWAFKESYCLGLAPRIDGI